SSLPAGGGVLVQRFFRFALIPAALIVGCTLALRAAGPISDADAELQLQLANLLIEETRYPEAFEAFERAAQAENTALALDGRKGKVRTSLRLAEFRMAQEEGQALAAAAPRDAEALTLYGDALWAAGLFDESDRLYQDATSLAPGSPRARFGRARSLATQNHLE